MEGAAARKVAIGCGKPCPSVPAFSKYLTTGSPLHCLVLTRSTAGGLRPPLLTSRCCRASSSSDRAYQLDDGFSSFILPLPPGPVQFPRKNLKRKFAVLLMRCAYDAADDLDFIPMDKFQIRFWKLRQSEVEPFTLQHSPLKVKYGDLTDPVCAPFLIPSFATYQCSDVCCVAHADDTPAAEASPCLSCMELESVAEFDLAQ